MAFLDHDGLRFHYLDIGEGLPFVFQHGLGGDVHQTSGIFHPPEGVRLVTFDCRAHGETRPLGDEERISLRCFADDLALLLDQLSIRRAVIGGISMGAAVALNFALRYTDRVIGLVLSRPAWLEGQREDNVTVFSLIARLLREHGLQDGQRIFQESALCRDILAESPDVANSLLGQFQHPRARETVAKLERIPRDQPYDRLEELTRITCPTLVLANRQDPIHPFAYGETLARTISGAVFRELTPKSVDKARHEREVQRFVTEFLMNFDPQGERRA